jgi:DNA-binding transcriptional ArsR family regulator
LTLDQLSGLIGAGNPIVMSGRTDGKRGDCPAGAGRAEARDEPRSVGEIAAHFAISLQAVSQHLQVLKEAGLVSEQRAGTRRLYVVRPDGLEAVRAFVEQLWPDRLARLKHLAETKSRHGRGE